MESVNTKNGRHRKFRRSKRHTPDEARRAIKDSARRFLLDRPFRDLTVAELMAGTPLSRPAFYQYFKDLHHLILSLLEEIETVMHQTANPWLAGEGEPIAALRESLRGVVETCFAHGPVIRAVSEAAPLDDKLERAWNEFMGRWDDAVEARILVQQEEGLIPAFDARRMAVALNRMDAAVMIAEFGKHSKGNAVEVLATEHRIWVGALYGVQVP